MENIKPVKDTYKGGFFKNRHRLSWRAPIVVKALIDTFRLKVGDTVVDVGCGIGDYVKEFNDRKIPCWGIEGSSAASEFFASNQIMVHDLRIPIDDGVEGLGSIRKQKLAFSLEVAEHIEPFHADTYIDNLCTLSDTILISAATPGQKGHGHVNCVPRDYWIRKFVKRGYVNMKGTEHRWRDALIDWRTKKELSSYFKNVICFQRRCNG